ncbi:O-methyltransferase, family 3 (plasmid) [Rhodospirillum rubrum ATCC 11170]|uniref:O-methyltransferase, family 3 n=1 Tax=Rhodospirillum rubrum (strain ATCC 11170 / ATH 1.1.1 / DSM 467 / LMG 4362 / NCIMB 8255 / S1) TaxID=269796 RepID=Q2RMN0_RHORT|nr:class I SAM-dependent methyltransferase [Rhodospirillum rubrum]ABC24615.1 O-methyltransferase, family 3 [Rhodospirillum rubrum ATCC 11170]QXG82502.1 class I SAM-dependent methyltransferase [Rhodospirillum rubrum]
MTSAVRNSLLDPKVSAVIERVWALQAEINPVGEAVVRADMARRTTPFTHREIVAACAAGSFACPPEIGRTLYALVRAIRPKVVLEFGTAHGFSTLHIAAALRDNGEGHLYGSEMHPAKVQAARTNLAEAGLADWVEVLEGDASETLGTVPDVDLLYLDGWTDHYLDVLQAVERNLRPGALIQADDVGKFGAGSGAKAYLAYVRDQANGYSSVTFTDYQGFEQSCFAGRP